MKELAGWFALGAFLGVAALFALALWADWRSPAARREWIG